MDKERQDAAIQLVGLRSRNDVLRQRLRQLPLEEQARLATLIPDGWDE